MPEFSATIVRQDNRWPPLYRISIVRVGYHYKTCSWATTMRGARQVAHRMLRYAREHWDDGRPELKEIIT